MTQFKDFWYTSAEGLRLYARDYTHAHAATTVICIPGLTRNSADFHELCELLAQDYRVLALDLRGRGRSAYDPEPMNYHPLTYAQDTERLLQAAGVDKAVFIGTSLGGLVSMTLAAPAPSSVQGIVLNDVGPELNPAGLLRIRSYLSDPVALQSWDEAVAKTRATQEAALPGLDDAQWLRFTRNLYREDNNGKPVLNYDPDIAVLFDAQDPHAPPTDLWPLFKSLIDIPMLVIRGAHSDILSADTVQKMQEAHNNLRTLTLDQRGHAPLLNEPAAEVAIVAFLENLCAGNP